MLGMITVVSVSHALSGSTRVSPTKSHVTLVLPHSGPCPLVLQNALVCIVEVFNFSFIPSLIKVFSIIRLYYV